MKFLNAFTWTFLLILLTGIFVIGTEWALADLVHAPKILERGVEGLSLAGLGYLFWIIFKQAYEAEKTGYQDLT
ncbi:MAG: hypothetical protein ACPGVT_01250 [Maricaulaceae bacterium]